LSEKGKEKNYMNQKKTYLSLSQNLGVGHLGGGREESGGTSPPDAKLPDKKRKGGGGGVLPPPTGVRLN